MRTFQLIKHRNGEEIEFLDPKCQQTNHTENQYLPTSHLKDISLDGFLQIYSKILGLGLSGALHYLKINIFR